MLIKQRRSTVWESIAWQQDLRTMVPADHIHQLPPQICFSHPTLCSTTQCFPFCGRAQQSSSAQPKSQMSYTKELKYWQESLSGPFLQCNVLCCTTYTLCMCISIRSRSSRYMVGRANCASVFSGGKQISCNCQKTQMPPLRLDCIIIYFAITPWRQLKICTNSPQWIVCGSSAQWC